MTLVTLLRHAWMDLLSAAIFLAVFLMRGYFEHETLSALLLWPVLFESMLVFALVLATMGNGITVQHAGVVGVEQGVLDAGEAGALAALDHDGVLAPDCHRRRGSACRRSGWLVGLGHRVDHVVGADHQPRRCWRTRG
jgi:hypothetical protein